MADLDLRRQLGQPVAAILALAALHEAGIAQLAQDGIEEFLGDVVGDGDLVDESELSGRQFGKVDEGLEPVFAFFGEHAPYARLDSSPRAVVPAVCAQMMADLRDASPRGLPRPPEFGHTVRQAAAGLRRAGRRKGVSVPEGAWGDRGGGRTGT